MEAWLVLVLFAPPSDLFIKGVAGFMFFNRPRPRTPSFQKMVGGKIGKPMKLRINSHDLGSVFRFLKAIRFLFLCKSLLPPTRRRIISYGNTWVKDVLLFLFLVFNISLFVSR